VRNRSLDSDVARLTVFRAGNAEQSKGGVECNGLR
jgi:hypothetical protein